MSARCTHAGLASGAESCRTRSAKPMFGKQCTSCRRSTSRQTMEACHPCSDTRGTSVFSWPPSTNTKPSSSNTVSSPDPATKPWQRPTPSRTFADGEVTVFHFVGGATLVGLQRRQRRLPRRHETEEARHASALQPSVSHVEWLLDGCDNCWTSGRRPTSSTTISAGNALHGFGAKGSFMERQP